MVCSREHSSCPCKPIHQVVCLDYYMVSNADLLTFVIGDERFVLEIHAIDQTLQEKVAKSVIQVLRCFPKRIFFLFQSQHELFAFEKLLIMFLYHKLSVHELSSVPQPCVQSLQVGHFHNHSSNQINYKSGELRKELEGFKGYFCSSCDFA